MTENTHVHTYLLQCQPRGCTTSVRSRTQESILFLAWNKIIMYSTHNVQLPRWGQFPSVKPPPGTCQTICIRQSLLKSRNLPRSIISMQLSPPRWGKRFSCSWASLHACSKYCFACTVSSCTLLSSLFPLPPSCFVLWLKAQAQPALLPTIYTATTITGSRPVKRIPVHYSTVNYHHRQACQNKLTKYILVMHSSQLLLQWV